MWSNTKTNLILANFLFYTCLKYLKWVKLSIKRLIICMWNYFLESWIRACRRLPEEMTSRCLWCHRDLYSAETTSPAEAGVVEEGVVSEVGREPIWLERLWRLFRVRTSLTQGRWEMPSIPRRGFCSTLTPKPSASTFLGLKSSS